MTGIIRNGIKKVLNTIAGKSGNLAEVNDTNRLLISSDDQKTAFGETSVAELTPVVQLIGTYGVTPKARTVLNNGGTAGSTGSEFFASTGTNAAGLASLFSERQLIYKAGQGAIARMSAKFSSGVVGNLQAAGIQTASDSFSFGYFNSTEFGIIYSHDGHVEIQELSVTTAASGSENATVTVDGVGYTVPLTSGSEVHNANEIADSLNSQVSNWEFRQVTDSTVVKVVARSIIADTMGSFAFTSSTAVATWSQIFAGIGPTRDFISQSTWNIDKLDGTGVSSMNLNPQNGNVYQIQFEYLGYGAITFSIEDDSSGQFQKVHRINYANNNTQPSVSNPSFRIAWSSINIGNTTDVTITGASCAGFIEGMKVSTEDGRALDTIQAGVGTTLTNIVTLRNRIVFGTNVNLSQILPQTVSISSDSNKSLIVEILKDADVAGDPDFTYEDKDNSVAECDTSGTTVTGGTLLHSFVVGVGASETVILQDFDQLILSGEKIVIGARVSSGAVAEVVAAINWKEDI